MNNYQWLLEMDGEERQAWFDAEHVDGVEIQGEVCEFEHEADSREKLEADVLRFSQVYYTSHLLVYDKVIELLDRQASISEAKVERKWSCYEGSVQAEIDRLNLCIAELAAKPRSDLAQRMEVDSLENRIFDQQNRIDELQAQVDSLTKELRKFKDMNNEAGDEIADLECERDYWKQQVQLCMDAAYPQSHSPERRYDPDVMAYPDRNGCTTPSTLVCDVIDGLRDGFQDKMMPILVEAAEAKQDVERWREGYGRILDEIHEIENTIRELGER